MTEQLLLIGIGAMWAFLCGMLVGRALYRPLYLQTRDALHEAWKREMECSHRVDDALEIAGLFESAFNEMGAAHKQAMEVVHKYEAMVKQLTEVSR